MKHEQEVYSQNYITAINPIKLDDNSILSGLVTKIRNSSLDAVCGRCDGVVPNERVEELIARGIIEESEMMCINCQEESERYGDSPTYRVGGGYVSTDYQRLRASGDGDSAPVTQLDRKNALRPIRRVRY